MDYSNKNTKPKPKKQMKKSRRSDDDDTEVEVLNPEPRVMLTPVETRNRTSSLSSSSTDDDANPKPSGKERRKKEGGKGSGSGDACLAAVAGERKELEKFLFDETNKVNRPAIRFILEKWAAMESRLQSTLIENELLKERCKNADKPHIEPRTYAQAAAMRRHEPRPPGSTEAKRRAPPKQNYEVVLIKPEKEDKRSNDQIRVDVLKKLDSVRKTLKVRSVRQMRKQGLVVEVQNNKDVETIQSCELNKIGLVVERPKKVNPSVIIYDIERDYKESDLKEDLIRKNFDNIPESDKEELIGEIRFTHSFKSKDERRVNWIVQLPAKLFTSLINAGKVFLMWRTYRLNEYLNITRCYKCHGYGHIAKTCNMPDQLCNVCGSKDHQRKDCPRTNDPQCINCIRAKRKEVKHEIHNRECPEYRRFLDLYNSRLKWD